jgi:glycosyltransferase involved in cell wall biosynthesis
MGKLNQMDRIKISIITVVFNNASQIKYAIDSVLSQTYQNIEYIVVDGASTDGTIKLIETYQDKISVFLSEPDKGLYYAMNKGINLATGSVIGILNSDDFYVDNSVIERVVSEFENTSVDSVFADLVYINSRNTSRVIRYFDSSIFNPSLFSYGLMPAHPTFFVKKIFYDKYGKFCVDFKNAADFDLLVRFIYINKITYSYIDKVIVKMRLGGASTSFSSIWTNNIEILRACKVNGIKTNMFKILLRYVLKFRSSFKNFN